MDSDRVSRAPPYSGYSRELHVFRIQDYHLLRSHFPMCSAIQSIFYSHTGVLQPQSSWFGLFPFRSPLLRESIFLSLPPTTKMFQFIGLLSLTLCIHVRITVNDHCWVPPFGNLRIKAAYSSPKHIVVRHVLHQLLVPRHPPCALTNLTTICMIFLS